MVCCCCCPCRRSFTDVKWMLSQQYKDLKATDRSLLLPDPEIRVLDINFRSHAGILDVGNAIVGPLRELSPHTIDRWAETRQPCGLCEALAESCTASNCQHMLLKARAVACLWLLAAVPRWCSGWAMMHAAACCALCVLCAGCRVSTPSSRARALCCWGL